MESNAKSVLSLEKLFFENITYSRKSEPALISSNYEMNFQREVSEYETNNHYRIKLTANICSEEKNIELSVSLVGFFTCECDDIQQKEALVKDNTVAIMFPYLRSQITLVSTQPDIAPIVLPTINVVSLFKDSDTNK